MAEQNRPIFTGTKIVTTGIGIGICILVAKYRTPILKQLKSLINYSDPLRNQQIHVVSCIEECRSLMHKLKMYTSFDCSQSLTTVYRLFSFHQFVFCLFHFQAL